MNTANERNVRALFDRVGVDALGKVKKDDLRQLEKLVKERGEIVHTGKAPAGFYKSNAIAWRDVVEALGELVDESIAEQAERLGGEPVVAL